MFFGQGFEMLMLCHIQDEFSNIFIHCFPDKIAKKAWAKGTRGIFLFHSRQCIPKNKIGVSDSPQRRLDFRSTPDHWTGIAAGQIGLSNKHVTTFFFLFLFFF